MKRLYATILLLMSVSAISFLALSQPRSIGGTFSPGGLGISYQHQAADSTFFEINAGIDLCGVLDGRTLYPGAKASFSYNFIFWSHDFRSGSLSSYAGIGLAAGYLRQTDGTTGPAAGLLGKIGIEYVFTETPVVLSLDFSPLLGMQIDSAGSSSNLRMYLDGLSKAYYPRLGIRYCF